MVAFSSPILLNYIYIIPFPTFFRNGLHLIQKKKEEFFLFQLRPLFQQARKLLADFLFEDLENDYSYMFANIHYSIHQNKIDGLPIQKNIYKWYIDKTNESMENIALNMNELLQTLTDDYTLCHGDFHPLNVIVDNKTDRYSIIDWNGAKIGSYILDVGWTYLTMNSPYVKHVYGEEVYNIVKIFSENYLKHYCNFKKIDKEIIIKYLPLVATRRLYDNYQNNLENNIYEKDWLQTIIKRAD